MKIGKDYKPLTDQFPSEGDVLEMLAEGGLAGLLLAATPASATVPTAGTLLAAGSIVKLQYAR